MELLLIVGGLIALAGLVFIWWRQRQSPENTAQRSGKASSADDSDKLKAWQPQATRILTAAERKAYVAIRSGLPEHIILAQVPLARFLKVSTRHSYSDWLRRVGVMCADLVVCDSASQVIAVVDIRPPESQENERAKQRHARMDRVLLAADIPLHVWREDALPNAVGARNALLKMPVDTSALNSRPAPLINPQPAGRNPVQLDAAMAIDDDGLERRDPPSSTWFDELDPAPSPVAPAAKLPRGSGPSIR